MSETIDLTGFIDLHIHTAPDIIPRLLSDIKVTQEALAAGMAGIMLKSHVTCTADRATIAQGVCGNAIQVWGGLALNRAIGGFNPVAVETAIQLGAKQIWMPTVDAQNEQDFRDSGSQGLSILDETGDVCSTVKDILKLIADADIILGTGHLSASEIMVLIPVAVDIRVKRILITHPDSPSIGLSIDQQRQLATMGCFFERCWLPTTPVMQSSPKRLHANVLTDHIRAVGVETTVLSTDLGQINNPTPIMGYKQFIATCLQQFPESDVQRMGAINPSSLIS